MKSQTLGPILYGASSPRGANSRDIPSEQKLVNNLVGCVKSQILKLFRPLCVSTIYMKHQLAG